MMSSFNSELSSVPPPKAFWLLLGLSIVLASEIATSLALHILGNMGRFLSGLYVNAPLAALLSGISLWWFLIVRPRRATIVRGLLVGMLASALAHPLLFLILPVLWIGPQQFLLIPSMLTWTIYSLIFGGWITIPIGGFLGLLLIFLQRTLTQQWRRRDHFLQEKKSEN
jgi:hypothetical protein